jgi:putative ABC transport system permease protein
VVAFDVKRRTRELGIRIALGADRRRIAALVLRQGATLTLIGAALGLVAAIGATRVLRGLLFGLTATDVPTYALIAGGLSLAGLAASWIPARRAGDVDPIVSLRAD